MSSAQKKDTFLWVLVAVIALVLGVGLGTGSAAKTNAKNTLEEYPLYQDDAVVQLPVMFSLNQDLVSEKTDMFGYCLTVTNRDVECYTMKGRFLGVGSVALYSNGDPSAVHVLDKAPEQFRQVMTNAFLRVWG